jgi:membrane dipeptidase
MLDDLDGLDGLDGLDDLDGLDGLDDLDGLDGLDGLDERRAPLPASEIAFDLLADTPLIDGHNDLPAALRKVSGYSVDNLESVRDELHTDIVKLRQGRVGAQFWSVWVTSETDEASAVVSALEQVDAVYRMVARYPRDLAFASTAADVERIFSSGRIASLMGIEGGHSIAESLGSLRMFARLGVRYMTLTHNHDTSWAASATGVRQSTGLNGAGRAIVAEMNRIGMIVDLSHTAESTQLDALAVSSAPLIFSHSSTRSLTDHARNVSDDVLSKLAANDGVVQITFVPEFVSQPYLDWERAAAAERIELGLAAPVGRRGSAGRARRAGYPTAPRPGETNAAAKQRNDDRLAKRAARGTATGGQDAMTAWLLEHPEPRATVRDVADHIEHARDAAGIDHIGIGGDFDGTPNLPDGLEDVSRYPALIEELASRHWSRDDLRRLAGQNVLRVMRGVEDAASEPMWPTHAGTAF